MVHAWLEVFGGLGPAERGHSVSCRSTGQVKSAIGRAHLPIASSAIGKSVVSEAK